MGQAKLHHVRWFEKAINKNGYEPALGVSRTDLYVKEKITTNHLPCPPVIMVGNRAWQWRHFIKCQFTKGVF